jgi:hypothetical protein
MAFAKFCSVLWGYKSPALSNLAFLFASVTLIVVLSYTAFGYVLLQVGGTTSDQANSLRILTVQYTAMAVNAVVMGACILRWKPRVACRPGFGWRGSINCPWVYVTAASIPLLLNLYLYYSALRGVEYVEIHKAGLGADKYILFLVVVTHAAFIRLFTGWACLSRNAKYSVAAAVVLFLFIYIFLMPLRTNLFIFGMYALHFFGGSIRWYQKVAFAMAGLILFSWIAMHRGGMDDDLKDMDLAQGTVSAMSFGVVMAEMVPWAYQEVQTQGISWGATSLSELVTTKYSPGNLYAQDKSPAYFEAGGGYGFFYVAELLLDFGYWGGLLSISILGMGLQQISISQSVIIRLTILPALLGCSFSLMRNDMMSTLKMPLYLIISCLILDGAAKFCLYTSRLITLSKLAESASQ